MPGAGGEKLRIILADDHAILRSGIRRLIAENKHMEVVGEASDGRALLDLLSREACDVLVMDLGMPNVDGFQALEEIRLRNPALRILVLSMHREAEFVKRALSHKVQGYLLKDQAFEQLVSAIEEVSRGKKVLSPEFDDLEFHEGGVIHESPISMKLLTPRERQVLGMLGRGWTNQVIADELNISSRTVEVFRRNIMEKLEFENFNDLLRYAIEKGLN